MSSPRTQKSRLPFFQNMIVLAHPAAARGALRPIVTKRRQRDAMDALVARDERDRGGRAKACGPGAPTLASSLAVGDVGPRGPIRRDPQGDGGYQARHSGRRLRGERAISRKTIAQGMFCGKSINKINCKSGVCPPLCRDPQKLLLAKKISCEGPLMAVCLARCVCPGINWQVACGR